MHGGLSGEDLSRSDSRVRPPQEGGHQPGGPSQHPGGQKRHAELAQQIHVNRCNYLRERNILHIMMVSQMVLIMLLPAEMDARDENTVADQKFNLICDITLSKCFS